jgi:hypothetical protein
MRIVPSPSSVAFSSSQLQIPEFSGPSDSSDALPDSLPSEATRCVFLLNTISDESLRVFLPFEFASLLTLETLESMCSEEPWHRLFDVRMSEVQESGDESERRMAVDGKTVEFSVRESSALAFYLKFGWYSFTGHAAGDPTPLHAADADSSSTHRFSSLEVGDLCTFSVLLLLWKRFAADSAVSSGRLSSAPRVDSSPASVPFDVFLSAHTGEGSGLPLRLLWSHIRRCRVLVIPTLLHLPGVLTMREWIDLLKSFETEVGLRVFPELEVERHFENKDLYMQTLAQMRTFRVYDQSIQAWMASGWAEPDNLIGPNPAAGSAREPLRLPSSSCSSDERRSDSDSDSPRAQPQAAAASSSPPILSELVVSSAYDSVVTLPSRIIATDSVHQVIFTKSHNQQAEFKSRTAVALKQAATKGGWLPPDSDMMVLKGTNSAACCHIRICDQAKLVQQMRELAVTSDVRPQSGFIIQSDSTKSLCPEIRIYFDRGLWLYAIATSPQTPDDRTLLGVHHLCHSGATASLRTSTSAHSVSSGGGFDPSHILSQAIDFAFQLLVFLEPSSSILSRSAFLRADLGVQRVMVASKEVRPEGYDWRPEERDLLIQTFQTDQTRRFWQLSGRGYIFRLFCNEITSSLDICLFTVSSVAAARSLMSEPPRLPGERVSG